MTASRALLCALLIAPAAGACRHRAFDLQGTAAVPEGEAYVGSALDERSEGIEAIHRAPDEHVAARTDVVRREPERHKVETGAFHLMVFPVTTHEYAEFVADTGAMEPWVPTTVTTDAKTSVPVESRFAWLDGRPPLPRRTHPIVLVTQDEATAYCAWWGARRGGHGRLPTAGEWEKAARGPEGAAYPGGLRPLAAQANLGPGKTGDTQPVHRQPVVTSGFGIADMAGNAAEWTSTLTPEGAVVKGGSWRSGPEFARAAAQRLERPTERHSDVGFRCVLERSGEARRAARLRKQRAAKTSPAPTAARR